METKQDTAYNGWKNRATWNVALWIGNDEPLYRSACAFMREYKGRAPYIDFILHMKLDRGHTTPDGIPWLYTMGPNDNRQLTNLSLGELNSMMRELVN